METILKLNKFRKVEYNTNDKNMVKNTQRALKSINNCKLPAQMFRNVIESIDKEREIIPSLCNEVSEYFRSYQNSMIEGRIGMDKFIYEIKKQSDFIKAFSVMEECQMFMIVIKDASFKNNKKYFKLAREIKREYECNFEITIFEENELIELMEQLKNYDSYREYSNAK